MKNKKILILFFTMICISFSLSARRYRRHHRHSVIGFSIGTFSPRPWNRFDSIDYYNDLKNLQNAVNTDLKNLDLEVRKLKNTVESLERRIKTLENK